MDNLPETCTNHVRELVDERIYILARMSNTKEALRLITMEKYDIHKAVEFCKVSQPNYIHRGAARTGGAGGLPPVVLTGQGVILVVFFEFR